MSRVPFTAGGDDLVSELCEIAVEAARVGSSVAQEALGRIFQSGFKPDGSEVTEIDVRAERAVVQAIRARRPADAFVGEESVAERPLRFDDPRQVIWVIDPIDGTRNYIRGLPLFACAVAAMRDGHPLAAAICEPASNRTLCAGRGHGAYEATRRLDLSATPSPVSGGRLIVAIPSIRVPIGRRMVQHAFDRHIVRNLGAASLHLMHAATGGFDLSITNNSKLWDVAPGALLITEAGGVATDLSGAALFPPTLEAWSGADMPSLAGGAAAHARFLAEIAALAPESRA